MATKLNKSSYTLMIEDNIDALEKHMPKDSLEKMHTIDVLKWSIDAMYGSDGKKPEKSENTLPIDSVSGSFYWVKPAQNGGYEPARMYDRYETGTMYFEFTNGMIMEVKSAVDYKELNYR